MSRIEVEGELELSFGGKLVLTNYSTASIGASNLLYVREDGSLGWKAELRDPTLGHFVSAERVGPRLCANTFDGCRVELDPETGRWISSEFTK